MHTPVIFALFLDFMRKKKSKPPTDGCIRCKANTSSILFIIRQLLSIERLEVGEQVHRWETNSILYHN